MSSTANDDTHKYCDEGRGSGASSKEMCTSSCEQNKNVDSSDSNSTSSTDINLAVDGINKMSISNTSIRLSTCANCGKEGIDSDMNTCNKCNSVKYCNAACKKKHRKKHKKKCDRRVAEMHEEKLFKQPPVREDCPICFLVLPAIESGRRYYSCCGKLICSGCTFANIEMNGADDCPFCRHPSSGTAMEMRKLLENRMEKKNDAVAIYNLGCGYNRGTYGCPLNRNEALELWHRAGELGCTYAYHNIACAYFRGTGVRRDEKKASHYWELAAIGGNILARHNLGVEEEETGNVDRALKHYMISAAFGYSDSLGAIKGLFIKGHATKDIYGKAIRSYQSYLDDIKSHQRDEAAAYNEQYRYY